MATIQSTRRAPNRPPDLTTFTVVHRAMRRDGARLAAALDGLGEGDTARARALRRWYGGYHRELDGHRLLEDHLWFPVLAERVPTFAEHADRIAREHHLLDDALRGVETALDRLVESEAAGAARQDAHDTACELGALLDLHLGFEDADILPLYVRHFSHDEYAEVEREARRMIEAGRLPFAVPWMLGAATPAERSRVLGSASLALRLVWYAGCGRHARLSARALGPATPDQDEDQDEARVPVG
jgi:Hemerythrin HHE cation binding domain